jgi:L-asparaginase II
MVRCNEAGAFSRFPLSTSLMSNPVLIEVTRGPLVESMHTGALAIAGPSGPPLVSLGQVSSPIYPRSAVKAVQCLPLIETGAADAFGYGDAEIALACASHSGTPRHTEVARAMLERLGLDDGALGCGVHAPQSAAAANALLLEGRRPSQLHNNCSGKHAGMIATARHLGEAIQGYWTADHPVQKRICRALSEMTGAELGAEVRGIDGCAVPTWAVPLAGLARLFARLVSGEELEPARRAAAERIVRACWAEPELVAGEGRADTVVMRKLPGEVFMKTGAEGVYCGGFPRLGVGFALKIDDGAKRAAAGATISLIERVVPAARGLVDKRVMRNWRGMEVGEIRSSAALERALDGAWLKRR